MTIMGWRVAIIIGSGIDAVITAQGKWRSLVPSKRAHPLRSRGGKFDTNHPCARFTGVIMQSDADALPRLICARAAKRIALPLGGSAKPLPFGTSCASSFQRRRYPQTNASHGGRRRSAPVSLSKNPGSEPGESRYSIPGLTSMQMSMRTSMLRIPVAFRCESGVTWKAKP